MTKTSDGLLHTQAPDRLLVENRRKAEKQWAEMEIRSRNLRHNVRGACVPQHAPMQRTRRCEAPRILPGERRTAPPPPKTSIGGPRATDAQFAVLSMLPYLKKPS